MAILMHRVLQPLNEYSENLLNYNSTFNNDLTFNITTGTGLIECNDEHYFEGGKSMKMTRYTGSGPVIFNTSSDLGFTANQTGQHIFSLRILYESSSGDGPAFVVNVFRNAVLYNQYSAIYAEEVITDNWLLFAQTMHFDAGDVITFTFEFNPQFVNDTIWVDGMKCEFDDRNLGLPTAWSMPKDFCCSDTKGYLSNTVAGWANYVDSLATPSIVIGTTYTQITIDTLGATNESYLPLEIRGTGRLFAGNKITPISIGDDYTGRFDVTVLAKTGTPTLIEFIIDISGSTPGTNKVFTGYIQTGGTIPYDQSLALNFFALATFKANGGKIYMRTDAGTITIGKRNIKLSRISKAF